MDRDLDVRVRFLFFSFLRRREIVLNYTHTHTNQIVITVSNRRASKEVPWFYCYILYFASLCLRLVQSKFSKFVAVVGTYDTCRFDYDHNRRAALYVCWTSRYQDRCTLLLFIPFFSYVVCDLFLFFCQLQDVFDKFLIPSPTNLHRHHKKNTPSGNKTRPRSRSPSKIELAPLKKMDKRKRSDGKQPYVGIKIGELWNMSLLLQLLTYYFSFTPTY